MESNKVSQNLIRRIGLIALTVLSLGQPIFVHAQSMGSKDGAGGGNVQRSSREDLEEIVNNIGHHLGRMSAEFMGGQTLRTSTPKIPNPFEKLTLTIFKSKTFGVTEDIRKAYGYPKRYEIVDGACFDRDLGERRDSSTEIGDRDATICLSADRLSRFPRRALKNAVLPLIFHEIAHQYGFKEKDANAFQDLANFHLTYGPLFLSATRARLSCALSSDHDFDQTERSDILNATAKAFAPVEWPADRRSADRTQTRSICIFNAVKTGQALEDLNVGDISKPMRLTTLSGPELRLLKQYSNSDTDKHIPFQGIVKALTEPAQTGSSDCSICKNEADPEVKDVDSYYILSLGAKAALELIDKEFKRIQFRQSSKFQYLGDLYLEEDDN